MRRSLRLRYLLAVPACLALTLLVAGHLRWPGSVGDVPPTVAAQQAQWAAHRPERYVLTVTHTSAAARSWFTLSQVTRGKVDNVLCRRYAGDDMIVECPVSDALYPVTVEQVFAALDTAYRGKFRGIDVKYDAQAGFPATLRFDPSPEKTGDEWGYDVEVLVVPVDNAPATRSGAGAAQPSAG